MKINDSYELVIDDIGCYILKHHYISQKTGNDRVKDIGYYQNIHQALEGCLKHGIIETELKDVKTVCNKLDKLNKDIQKAIEKYPKNI